MPSYYSWDFYPNDKPINIWNELKLLFNVIEALSIISSVLLLPFVAAILCL